MKGVPTSSNGWEDKGNREGGGGKNRPLNWGEKNKQSDDIMWGNKTSLCAIKTVFTSEQ